MNGNTMYPDNFMSQLEVVWGKGYLSPGGADEVKEILRSVDVAEANVLDIGCGTGGPAITIADKLNAAHVTGVDVEPQVVSRARQNVTSAGLDGNITIKQVQTGTIPFKNNSFDIVFSKDSLLHIPNKRMLYNDVFRLLRKGGVFVFSDWLCSENATQAPAFQRYTSITQLDMNWQTPAQATAELERAGFVDIKIRDRNAWYARVAREDVNMLSSGALREQLVALSDDGSFDDMMAIKKANAAAAEAGALRPTHFYCIRPESSNS